MSLQTDFLLLISTIDWQECISSNMLMGEIILLYKKKDPRDIRNYRPITLLNTVYKILTKVLVARLKQVIEEVISSVQTGFVPGTPMATYFTEQMKHDRSSAARSGASVSISV